MSDIERLVAIERLKDLKARQDHALDRKDWATYDALHAPDHTPKGDGAAPRDAARTTVHHSHSPRFEFESPERARGIWGVEDNIFWTEGGEDCWLQSFGFIHETYEKRDGTWLFTGSARQRHKTILTRRPAAAGR